MTDDETDDADDVFVATATDETEERLEDRDDSFPDDEGALEGANEREIMRMREANAPTKCVDDV